MLGCGAGGNMSDALVATAQDEVRVLLVDDHDLFRTGLRNLLEEHGACRCSPRP